MPCYVNVNVNSNIEKCLRDAQIPPKLRVLSIVKVSQSAIKVNNHENNGNSLRCNVLTENDSAGNEMLPSRVVQKM